MKSKLRLVLGLFLLVNCQAIAASGATRTVDTVSDAGGLSACTAAPDDCSLRGAIAGATAGDTIDFASPLFDSPQVITLSEAAGFQQLVIDKNLTVTGKGAHLTTVRRSPQAAAQFRVFQILSGTVSISGLTITGGSSTGDGGGIRSFGTLTLTAVHLTGNTAGFNGGGIFNTIGAGSLTVINSTISNNTANNNASAAGGGISDYSDGTTLTITNSTISGNRVPNGDQFDGGGIYVRESSVVITNSTITDNETAGSNSAGGVITRFQPSTVSVRNSIIAGNCTRTTNALCANTTTPDIRGTDGGVFASQGYNLIGNVGGETVFIQTGDQTGNATAPLGPRLLPLADNGGMMPTHRLSGNSPALDKGDCGGCSSDQRGFSRPVDLPSIANVSDASDIGSFELQSSELVDSTPPVITPTVTGTLGNNGWYTSNVQVSWSVVDDETFISTQTGCAIQTVTTDTSGVTFTCSATSLGGSSTQSVTIKRDATAPTITFASQTTPNAAGWNNTNVAVQWNCSDALSGATTPNTTNIVSTEGANQSTTGTCTDNAGNTSTNTRSGINIDKTAPNTVFASQTPAPNAAGWNNTNVTVNWNCTDAVSGPVNSTVSQTLTTEGSNLSATGTCTDVAGNNSSNTRSGIKIDKTAPSITFNNRTPAPNAAGWNNTNVTVNWNCADTLSGPASPTASQLISAEGSNLSSTGTCTDAAGNTASNTQSGISIDKTAPTITFVSRTPAPNAAGWNNTNVTVNWSCADALSGATSPTTSQVLSTEGANLSSIGTCSDLAGNSASNTQSGIRIDKTAPTITFASRTTPNAAGWNNTNVTVNWNCADALSGATSPTTSQLLTVEGANLSSTGTCSDVAGNSASNTQTGIKIDKTAPTLAPVVTPNPVILNASATVAANAADALSGIASQSCAPVVTSTVGFKVVACIATDVAGNSAGANANYQVIYNFSGFTGRVVNPPTVNYVFAGNTIPVGFSLSGDKGLNIFAAGSPSSQQVNCMTGTPIGASTPANLPFGLQFFGGQYTFYWQTDATWTGSCRQLSVALNDGTTRTVNFQFF